MPLSSAPIEPSGRGAGGGAGKRRAQSAVKNRFFSTRKSVLAWGAGYESREPDFDGETPRKRPSQRERGTDGARRKTPGDGFAAWDERARAMSGDDFDWNSLKPQETADQTDDDPSTPDGSAGDSPNGGSAPNASSAGGAGPGFIGQTPSTKAFFYGRWMILIWNRFGIAVGVDLHKGMSSATLRQNPASAGVLTSIVADRIKFEACALRA
jgi:hypothetical protein